MSESRLIIKFGGESGQGINTLGQILSKSIKESGFYNFAYREYPSLIKGGVASYQIDISDEQIASSSRYCNILSILSKDAIHDYLPSVSPNGVVIYNKEDLELSQEENNYIKENNITLISLDTIKMALEVQGIELMANMVLLGFIWKLLGLDTKPLEEIVRDTFKDKNVDLEAEIRCAMVGYNSNQIKNDVLKPITFKPKMKWKDSLNITGNEAVALGAISAGCRAFYAYPMTPATSIFKYLGDTYKKTGILIKQAENEITAAQLVMGSMNMGTRAMTATSGGGFDLMTETISCAGISETPMVIVLAQRVGAGTGVPTWTGAGDLSLALHGGHGEFPRCIMSVSNPQDAYTLTQEAFNIAETYQIPVILLTDKQIAESIFNIKDLPKPIDIERGISNGEYRYEITDSGISPRWIPSINNPTYLQTSDEHNITGESTEQSNDIVEMSDKRLRKVETLREQIREPEYFGSKNPDIVFVGYGSAGNTVGDTLKRHPDVGYLHYQYIYPLKYEKIIEIDGKGARIVLIENNQTGDFGKLIKQESGFEITERILKYDGRPLFLEDILNFLND
ncbi:2-oxoacid:acceptor oxidoreductase subunit alpha [bacterium]|nr:2-oxoacid:acceptor oxidoreductase subunit alpha [bacterium]